MTEKSGTFVVTHADSESAILKDPEGGQVHTLGSNPDFEAGDVVEATVEPEPPLEAVWQVVDVASRRSVSIERSPEPPTTHERDVAEGQPDGELTRVERAGHGELHVISVPTEQTEQATEDVLSDREVLLTWAARLDVNRVEIRSGEGCISVRYLP